jgi:hypothetical protein
MLPLSVQLLITDARGYPFVCKRTWFIEEQSTVYVGRHILLVDREIPQVPSMSLSCGFARLFTAAEPENRSAQKNRQLQKRWAFDTPDLLPRLASRDAEAGDTQNRPNESVFHCTFLLKINNPGLLSSRGYS